MNKDSNYASKYSIIYLKLVGINGGYFALKLKDIKEPYDSLKLCQNFVPQKKKRFAQHHQIRISLYAISINHHITLLLCRWQDQEVRMEVGYGVQPQKG